jgi:hypothetical protein
LRNFDIVFVPGLRPKPPNAVYREVLLQCMLAGLKRYAPAAAAELRAAPQALRVYSWTDEVYGEHRDIELDRAGIDAILEQDLPDAAHLAEIYSFRRRLAQLAHRVGDRIPLLGRLFASERQRTMLSEARSYLRDRDGVGSRTRAGLSELLKARSQERDRLVIVAHSLGSVISYDTLWELSQQGADIRVDLLLTIGSPLGTRFVRRLVKGVGEPEATRYPRNIVRWTNISAVGELTALYPRLSEQFGAMKKLGIIDSFEDFVDVPNYFTGPGGLNVHSEYGYAMQAEFARSLASAILPTQSS